MNELKEKENFWNPSVKHLGSVIPGTTYKTEFEYLGDKKIRRIDTSCGCTVADWTDNKIQVEFTPKPKPAHLETQQVSKNIQVYFEDNSSELLKIEANVGHL